MRESTRRQLQDHEVRIKQLEGKTKTTEDIRDARATRRDWWVSKLLPSISGCVIAILGLNALFHWF